MRRRKQQKVQPRQFTFKNYHPLDDDEDYVNAPEGSIAYHHKLGRLKEEEEEGTMLEGGEADRTIDKTYAQENSVDDILFLGGGSENKDNKSQATRAMGKRTTKIYSDVDKNMSEVDKKNRIHNLWDRARKYTNKLMFQTRLQKMADNTNKEDKHNQSDEGDQEEENQENQPQLSWYLVDTDKPLFKAWDFFITLITIYCLFVTPMILVFPEIYEDSDNEEAPTTTWKYIEYVVDSIFLVEIMISFVKRTNSYKDIQSISYSYLSGSFIFDVVATVPELIFFQEGIKFYGLKTLRIVHGYRLTQPLRYFLLFALEKYSKKRQTDLIGFTGLIFIVIYTSHIMACAWIFLGKSQQCLDEAGAEIADCAKSWVYDGEFADESNSTQYIFAFYWIFEVITTVGYGDYSGSTSEEYIFSIALEFMGLTFFSFLMGSINGIFNTSDNFDDLIEEKLDQLDMWIKKIEKSNQPFHIQPTLYNDIRKYVEQAFLFDFNLVLEEFQFYQQITPKMQTDLIQNTRVFKKFEEAFKSFFQECERGFTNEIIINMYCRIYTPGKTIIAYKSDVKEMYFIRQGLVEVYNNENDEIYKDKPIFFLPNNTYFGDYQILYSLKSNIVFKTLGQDPNENAKSQTESMPDIIFMCVSKEALQDLCELFPYTADNIKQNSLKRRRRFMKEKNRNSRKYNMKTEQEGQEKRAPTIGSSDDSGDNNLNEEELKDFHSDEDYDNLENQKEDMEQYIEKATKKTQELIDVLKQTNQLVNQSKAKQAVSRDNSDQQSNISSQMVSNRNQMRPKPSQSATSLSIGGELMNNHENI